MAEPQATSEQPRAKGDTNSASGAPSGAAPTESRSFDQAKPPQARDAGEALAQAAQPLVEGGRQLAQQGREAGRQMTTAWRQAVDPLLAMQYDFSRFFDDMWRQTFGFRGLPAAQPALSRFSAANLFGLPPADLKETETAHVLAIELPGLATDDIDICIDGDALVVRGQKTEETQDATSSYRMSERRYGAFERAFPLPPDVDRTKIEAQFRDGVLKVTLPKDPNAAPKRARIEVKN